MAKVEITQRKSSNGASRTQRETLRSLGLRRIGQKVEHEDTPQVRGMVRTVVHLVDMAGDRDGR
jgi:large subunit ribosomal protein L30